VLPGPFGGRGDSGSGEAMATHTSAADTTALLLLPVYLRQQMHQTVLAKTHDTVLQQNATHCNTPQHTAAILSGESEVCVATLVPVSDVMFAQHPATHCNTLQHTATLVQVSDVMFAQNLRDVITLQNTAANCISPQHTATHCNTLNVMFAANMLSGGEEGTGEDLIEEAGGGREKQSREEGGRPDSSDGWRQDEEAMELECESLKEPHELGGEEGMHARGGGERVDSPVRSADPDAHTHSLSHVLTHTYTHTSGLGLDVSLATVAGALPDLSLACPPTPSSNERVRWRYV